MKVIITFIILTLLTGCGMILINENEYRNLTDADSSVLRPFNLEIVSQYVDNSSNLVLYEINTNDFGKLLRKQKYTWIHLWRPFCPSEVCQNINYYLNAANKLKHLDLEFLLVSESYDIYSIKNCLRNSFYNRPIYVLQDSYYGHKIRPTRLKFYREIVARPPLKTRIGFEDYLFEDTTLIFAGNGLDTGGIDSLIIENNMQQDPK